MALCVCRVMLDVLRGICCVCSLFQRAEACLPRLSALNPMVRFTHDSRGGDALTAADLAPFDAVYLASANVDEQVTAHTCDCCFLPYCLFICSSCVESVRRVWISAVAYQWVLPCRWG